MCIEDVLESQAEKKKEQKEADRMYKRRSGMGAAFAATAVVPFPGSVLAQSAEDANKSNNPLTPAPAFNIPRSQRHN